MSKRVAVALLFGLMPGIADCASLVYMDADNPGEAVGLLKAREVSAQVMLRECSARFPADTEEYKSNLFAWQKQEEYVLKKVDALWSAAASQNPSLAEVEARMEAVIAQTFESISKVQPNAIDKLMAQYCRRHFSALAAGVWRERTPKAQHFLESMP